MRADSRGRTDLVTPIVGLAETTAAAGLITTIPHTDYAWSETLSTSVAERLSETDFNALTWHSLKSGDSILIRLIRGNCQRRKETRLTGG